MLPLSRVLVLLTTSLVAACSLSSLNQIEGLNHSELTEADSDLARTFDRATVVLPAVGGDDAVHGEFGDPRINTRLKELSPRGGLPTIVYMHGCTGLRNLDPLLALASQGFVVIAPNSFARRFRPLQCKPSAKTGGENVFVFDFRLAEVSYALHRMRRLPWIDGSRLALFGVSEGGVAAALYRGNEFRARVIAQWTCHGNPLVRGIHAPAGEPVLAVVRAEDPWYDARRTHGQSGDCGAFMTDRSGSDSIVVGGAPGHQVLEDTGTIVRIASFLRRATEQ